VTACKNCPATIERLPSGHWVDGDGFYQCKKMLDGEERMLHEPLPGSPVDEKEFPPPPALPRRPRDDHYDDEIGVMLDADGSPPREADGRHCKYCGEEIEVPFARGLHDCVQEFRHKASGTVHCVIAWVNGLRASFAEETATPCWTPGCLSNAEHEARQHRQGGEGHAGRG
jgi:hypothetical protein